MLSPYIAGEEPEHPRILASALNKTRQNLHLPINCSALVVLHGDFMHVDNVPLSCPHIGVMLGYCFL